MRFPSFSAKIEMNWPGSKSKTPSFSKVKRIRYVGGNCGAMSKTSFTMAVCFPERNFTGASWITCFVGGVASDRVEGPLRVDPRPVHDADEEEREDGLNEDPRNDRDIPSKGRGGSQRGRAEMRGLPYGGREDDEQSKGRCKRSQKLRSPVHGREPGRNLAAHQGSKRHGRIEVPA